MEEIRVIPIPIGEDGFSYLLMGLKSGEAAVIDCGEAEPVIACLKSENLVLDHIFITHHHEDHIAGVPALLKAYPQVNIVKPAYATIKFWGNLTMHGDISRFGLNRIKTNGVPFHTKFCKSYFIKGHLFTGDALFSVGCGRRFDGTELELLQTMRRFREFDDETNIYPGHEYSLQNIQFAKTIEPENQDLLNYEEIVKRELKDRGNCIPAKMGLEKRINPFLRYDVPAVINTVDPDHKLDAQGILSRLRKMKDEF